MTAAHAGTRGELSSPPAVSFTGERHTDGGGGEQDSSTFNRPNVTLIDVSEAKVIERITPKAVVANGVEYEVDCIIYATGFEIGSFLRSARFEVYGRDGRVLSEYFKDGLRTLHGHSTNGFPSWFFFGVGAASRDKGDLEGMQLYE